MRIPRWVKHGLWGVAIGAIGAVALLFGTDAVVTSSGAERMAKQNANEAVIAALAPICVAKFKRDDAMAVNLANLEKQDTWKRSEFVSEGGWATMPGSEMPRDGVASACKDELMKLVEQGKS